MIIIEQLYMAFIALWSETISPLLEHVAKELHQRADEQPSSILVAVTVGIFIMLSIAAVVQSLQRRRRDRDMRRCAVIFRIMESFHRRSSAVLYKQGVENRTPSAVLYKQVVVNRTLLYKCHPDLRHGIDLWLLLAATHEITSTLLPDDIRLRNAELRALIDQPETGSSRDHYMNYIDNLTTAYFASGDACHLKALRRLARDHESWGERFSILDKMIGEEVRNTAQRILDRLSKAS
jgi:hypothetical protein